MPKPTTGLYILAGCPETKTNCPNLSRQASPNFHVGCRLILRLRLRSVVLSELSA